MKSSKVPRLRRIRVMMLLSVLVLAAFLGYWLRSEYLREKETLRKDFSAILMEVNRRLDDSLMMQFFVRPIQQEIAEESDSAKPGGHDSARSSRSFTYSLSSGTSSPVNVKMLVRHDSSSRQRGDSIIISRRKRIQTRNTLDIRSENVSQDSFHSYWKQELERISDHPGSADGMFIYENAQDSITFVRDSTDERMTRGIKLLIQSLTDLPDKISRQLRSADSGSIRGGFQRELTRRGMGGTLHWMPDSMKAANMDLLLDRDILQDRRAAVTGYESQLVSRTAPQILFSSFLLCLTALAFGITYRALRSQMELATIRNDFISNMSHELKTPVSTMKVALEAISEPAVLEDKELTGEYLHMATLELSRLELLINQALQSALLEGGRLRMDHEQVDLRILSAQMCRIMQGRFAQQNGSLSMAHDGDDFTIPGDALHIQGVVVNILDNALKYAGPAPQVELTLTATGDRIQLQIGDRGPGIPAQYRTKIFEKFFRVPRGNEHSVKGYGLGLNYAAEVVRSHRGTIELKDRPGGGSSFVLSFPKHRV